VACSARLCPSAANLTEEGRQRGIKRAGEVSRKQADDAYVDLVPLMLAVEIGRSQPAGDRGPAERVRQDYPPREAWNYIQVARVLKRVGSQS